MIDPNNECLEQFLIIFYEIFDLETVGWVRHCNFEHRETGQKSCYLIWLLCSSMFLILYERIMEVNRVPFIKMNRLFIHCEPGFKGPGKPQDLYIINASLLSPTLPFLMILRL